MNGGAGLVLVAHGTRSAPGVQMIAALTEAVAHELDARDHEPAAAVRTAFVDVLGPSPAEVLRTLAVAGTPAVVVPAFLASGYHVHQDIPRAVENSAHPSVTVAPALGPDPALADIMVMRLRAVGWRRGDAVVLAAAGSSDPRARTDVGRVATMLSVRLPAPVHSAYIATAGPGVADIVGGLRRAGHRRIIIAPYLLAHGLFHQRLHTSGATAVADPIGVHPAVVRLIVERYRVALRGPSRVDIG